MIPLDSRDLGWVAQCVDIVALGAGLPWRIALEQLEQLPIGARQLAPVISALRMTLGRRARHAALARRARGLVLGVPALAPGDRARRIEEAAHELGLSVHELEAALWADLPRERPIELRYGPPQPLVIAGLANVLAIQRALRRACSVELRLWGGTGEMLRAAAAHGLLATASRGATGEQVLEVIGPLALCHRTTVYGRALGNLVPLLAAHARFELAIRGRDHVDRLRSPMLLPPATPPSTWTAAARLARALERAGAAVTRDPSPLAAGAELVFPDLAIGETPIEIVGFWTASYLATKLARYRAAGAPGVVLCVDDSRACTTDPLPAGKIVRFRGKPDPDEVLACC